MKEKTVNELVEKLTEEEKEKLKDVIEDCRLREMFLKEIEQETGKKVEELNQAEVEFIVNLEMLCNNIQLLHLMLLPSDWLAKA